MLKAGLSVQRGRRSRAWTAGPGQAVSAWSPGGPTPVGRSVGRGKAGRWARAWPKEHLALGGRRDSRQLQGLVSAPLGQFSRHQPPEPLGARPEHPALKKTPTAFPVPREPRGDSRGPRPLASAVSWGRSDTPSGW